MIGESTGPASKMQLVAPILFLKLSASLIREDFSLLTVCMPCIKIAKVFVQCFLQQKAIQAYLVGLSCRCMSLLLPVFFFSQAMERLSPDSLTIIASYIAVIELHLVVTHGSTVTPERLPRWDDNLMHTQAFLRRFGSYQHPLPWHVRTTPLHTTWTVHFYTSHLDLGALIRLAAVAKPLVKPMAQLSEHVPVTGHQRPTHSAHQLYVQYRL